MPQDVFQEIGKRAIEDRQFWESLRRKGAKAAVEAGFSLSEREQGALDSMLRENCVELSSLVDALQETKSILFGYWRRP